MHAVAGAGVETWYRALVEFAPDALVLVDRDGKIVLVNKQTEVLFGYTREALIGADVELLVPEEARAAHVGHRRGYDAQPNVRPMGAGLRLEGRRNDGARFPIEISLSPLQTESGQYVTAAIRDITDRRVAERKLAETAARLEAQNKELEQFAYSASHDLQAPLRTIIGFTEVLREKLGDDLDEEAAEYFAFIESDAHRMRTLILDLLELSRTNNANVELVPVEAEDVVAQACRQLDVELKEKGAVVARDGLPQVRADPALLGRVFQNLLSNAVKFASDERAPHIVISAEREDADRWRFAVADNGIGIPARRIERTFEVFKRFHDPKKYEGTGIGTAICKKVVELHGGRIWVESTEGVGTTFFFTLYDALAYDLEVTQDMG